MYLRAAAASACRVRATLLVPLFDAAGRGAGVLLWADGPDALVPDRPFAVLELAVAQANPYGILGLYMWMRDRLSVRALACFEVPMHVSGQVWACARLGAEHPVCTVLAWCGSAAVGIAELARADLPTLPLPIGPRASAEERVLTPACAGISDAGSVRAGAHLAHV